jgi:hypothetical protein
VAQHFSIGSSATRRNPDNRQICILSNRHPARQPAEDFRVLPAGRAKRNERQPAGERDRIIAGVMAVSILLPIIVRPPRRQ